MESFECIDIIISTIRTSWAARETFSYKLFAFLFSTKIDSSWWSTFWGWRIEVLHIQLHKLTYLQRGGIFFNIYCIEVLKLGTKINCICNQCKQSIFAQCWFKFFLLWKWSNTVYIWIQKTQFIKGQVGIVELAGDQLGIYEY